MKTLMSILTLVVAAFSTQAVAANAACEATAKEKKLAGAALTSFMKKCEADAGGASNCEAMAAEKKLAGAAKTSFVTKCEKDGGQGRLGRRGLRQAGRREEAGRRRAHQLHQEVRHRRRRLTPGCQPRAAPPCQ